VSIASHHVRANIVFGHSISLRGMVELVDIYFDLSTVQGSEYREWFDYPRSGTLMSTYSCYERDGCSLG
jgi:hypothetical protein